MRKKDLLKRILAEAVVLSILTEGKNKAEGAKEEVQQAAIPITPQEVTEKSVRAYLKNLLSSVKGSKVGKGWDYAKDYVTSNKAQLASALTGGTLGGLGGYELGKLITSAKALGTLKAALEKEKEASQALKRLRILKSLASSKEAKKLRAAASDIEKSRLLSYILGAAGAGVGGYAGVKAQPTISSLISKLKKK